VKTVRFEQLLQMPRYLKALLTRAERASLNPVKDQEKACQVAPYVQELAKLRANAAFPEKARTPVEEFRWAVPEKLELVDGHIPGEERLVMFLLATMGLRRVSALVGRHAWASVVDQE
jgi:hypothetical protein